MQQTKKTKSTGNFRRPYSKTIEAEQMKPAFTDGKQYFLLPVSNSKEIKVPCAPDLWVDAESSLNEKFGSHDLKSKTKFLVRINSDGVAVHVDMYPNESIQHGFGRTDLEGRTTVEIERNERGDLLVSGIPDKLRRADLLRGFIDAVADAGKWPLRAGDKIGNGKYRVRRADGDVLEIEPIDPKLFRSIPAPVN